MNDTAQSTKNHTQKIKSRKKMRWLYRWHKKIGLFFCLWLILLAVTGILLNHTEDLYLNQKPIQSDWLLDWHDITAPEAITAFMPSKNKIITQIDNAIFLNDQSITQSSEPLMGSIEIDHLEIPMIVLAFQTYLEQFTTAGEKIDTHPLHSPVQKIGVFHDNKKKPIGIIETNDGSYLYSQDLIEWKSIQPSPNPPLEKVTSPVQPTETDWAKSILLTDKQRQEIQKQYRQTQLSWEKVILSLHNGYFFGTAGKWLTDIWGMLAIFISITGFYLWKQKNLRKY
jgi:hypothetical protein